MTGRFARRAVATLVLLGALAACGDDDTAGPTTSPAAPTAPIPTAPTPTATTEPHTTEPDTTNAPSSGPAPGTQPAPATTATPTTATPVTVPPTAAPARPTIVLVHGAFAGPASWDAVAALLRDDGYEVVVPVNPLRGPTVDAAAVREALDAITGDVILVGHSYGGIPITNAATGDPDVRALVYVAAYVPDDGQTFSQIQELVPGRLTPDRLVIAPYTAADGTSGAEATIAADGFAELFAADLPADQAAALATSQMPLDLLALSEPSGAPAWREIPSWYLAAAGDQIIPVELAETMAELAGASYEEVDASHAVLLSQPEAVAELIAQVAG